MRSSIVTLLLAIFLNGASSARADAPGDASQPAAPGIYLVSPDEGEVVTPKPVLRIGFRGQGLDRARFRIVLSREGAETPLLTWEQDKAPASWRMYLEHEDPGVAYRPEEPLGSGPYVWTAALWDGAKWTEAGEKRTFVVDGVPPSPVLDVRIRRNPEKGTIFVDWEPVTKDRDGGPETDLQYRLYRYEPRPFFHGLLLNELALVNGTHWEDRDPKAIHSPTLFYVIKPVDRAGNEPEAP